MGALSFSVRMDLLTLFKQDIFDHLPCSNAVVVQTQADESAACECEERLFIRLMKQDKVSVFLTSMNAH